MIPTTPAIQETIRFMVILLTFDLRCFVGIYSGDLTRQIVMWEKLCWGFRE